MKPGKPDPYGGITPCASVSVWPQSSVTVRVALPPVSPGNVTETVEPVSPQFTVLNVVRLGGFGTPVNVQVHDLSVFAGVAAELKTIVLLPVPPGDWLKVATGLAGRSARTEICWDLQPVTLFLKLNVTGVPQAIA